MGTPLSPAERSDILGRQSLSKYVAVIQKHALNEPSYGGVWIDQKAGGIVRVATTSPNVEPVYERLRASLPDDGRVVPVRVSHTLVSLRSVYKKISKDMVDRAVGSQYIIKASVSVPTNTVSVIINASTPASVRATLEAKYDDPVVRITSSSDGFEALASRNFHHGRVTAGMWLSSLLSPGCTVGYGATRSADGKLWAVTAGHCSGTTFYLGKDGAQGDEIGQSHQNKYFADDTGNCDCQVVGPMAPSGQASRDLLIQNNATYDLTHTGGKPEQGAGTYVCMSGANYYEASGGQLSCGLVTDDEASVTYPDDPDNPQKIFTLTDATTPGLISYHGDSGAPVNAGNALLGVVSAGRRTANEIAFSKAYNISARTGVDSSIDPVSARVWD